MSSGAPTECSALSTSMSLSDAVVLMYKYVLKMSARFEGNIPSIRDAFKHGQKSGHKSCHISLSL